MSKTADVYIIREHENSVLTRTIPEQTRLSLFTRHACPLFWGGGLEQDRLRALIPDPHILEQSSILTTVSSSCLPRKRVERNG